MAFSFSTVASKTKQRLVAAAADAADAVAYDAVCISLGLKAYMHGRIRFPSPPTREGNSGAAF